MLRSSNEALNIAPRGQCDARCRLPRNPGNLGAIGPSVIRLRIEGMRAPEVVKVVARAVEDFGQELQEGALVTVKTRKTTSHRLPIGGLE